MQDYFNFLWVMTSKEIKARYKNAFLGFLWIFLNPLFQMLVIGFIFQKIIKTPIRHYFSFLFAGLLAWNFFAYSFTKATPAFVWERTLIKKARFPREAIPLSIVFANFFHFLASFLLFFIFLLAWPGGHISWLGTATIIMAILWIVLFTIGATLLSSALNVKYRDVNFFIQALLILWFYATPVIYSLNILPPVYLPLFQFNPLAYPFALLHHSLVATPLPPASILWTNLGLSFLIIVLGILVFRRESKFFADWL